MTTFDDETDDRLVETARAEGSRDTRAFEELVRRHRGFVTANCRVITRSAADAEDLAQDVFVKAFFGLPRFEGRSQFRGWVQRIKVNHCLNHLRKAKGAVMVDIDDVQVEGHDALRTAAGAHEALQTSEDRQLILRALDSIPDTLRLPLLLRDADGLAYEEIAEQLGIGLSAVKMRIKRGREAFRLRFAGPSPERPTSGLGSCGISHWPSTTVSGTGQWNESSRCF